MSKEFLCLENFVQCRIMFRPRVIPCLLLSENGLVKTVQFEKPNYIGDPINAVRIFNDLIADELIFLDIHAGKKRARPRFELIEKISEEAFMPFSIGGGINTLEDVKSAFNAGTEKVILNTVLFDNSGLIEEAAAIYGSQAIVGSVDVKEEGGHYSVWSNGGLVEQEVDLKSHIQKIQALGVGEIMINSISRDGLMCGYDTNLISMISDITEIPIIACGGAEDIEEFPDLISKHGASACAAGSIFVYFGSRNAVMLNYPDKEELSELFEN